MLWVKESKKSDALYVNIFPSSQEGEALRATIRELIYQTNRSYQKDDAKSLKLRQDGNREFGCGNWNDAIELYNASLRYAENGSSNISLAYANRSACFLKVKRYSECLIDIELAKDAGYPSDLMPKLDARKAECLKLIEEGAQSIKFGLQLDFEPGERFPFMANVLKIDRTTEGELAMFAKTDIAVDQTIVVEKAFMPFVFMWYGWRCNICLNERVNLVPCQKCTSAMFCFNKCQGDSVHDHECGLRFCDESQMNGIVMRAVRSCLLAIDMFSDAEELMNFVERTIKSDRNEIPSILSNTKSQYATFLNLPIRPRVLSVEQERSYQYESYRMLLNIPKVNAMFQSEKSRRFLMHLIVHHDQVLECNSTTALTNSDIDHQEMITSQTGLMYRYFKHSCAPNVMISTFSGNLVIITVRPVRKGDQLLHAMLVELLLCAKQERHRILLEQRNFICKCDRCKGASASLVQRKRMESDPDLQYVISNLPALLTDGNEANLQTMFDKSKRFLQMYGHLLWCEELGFMVFAYIKLIYARNRGAIRGNMAGKTD